ncbi:MAG: HAMP domain-containing sensor histidine kinase [Eubacteriales bacterium]|nr:HAMP domain-containing sensor histidine kinase [Eubacteriales bacterium]
MSRKIYERNLGILICLFVVVSVGMTFTVYQQTGNSGVSAVVLAGCILLCLLAFLQHRLEDRYITDIVIELSRLTDVLVELEEKEIFPENEDTVLSKLQSKVIKLVRILKHQNEMAAWEHENIKELVSDIAHQLKTPISNLKMYSQFLQEESLSEKQRKEYTEVICMSVERLNFLSENMIKISRLEGGLIQLNMQRQSLNETILKAVKDIYPKAKEKGTEICYSEEKEIMMHHDRNWTAEALFNLLDNAVKYARPGSRIDLRVRRLSMFVEISVEDENGAIPQEEQSKIFARFYRGRNSRKQEGVGVGLYLCREIVTRQGGYMNLKTTEKGNVFSMVLYQRTDS